MLRTLELCAICKSVVIYHLSLSLTLTLSMSLPLSLLVIFIINGNFNYFVEKLIILSFMSCFDRSHFNECLPL